MIERIWIESNKSNWNYINPLDSKYAEGAVMWNETKQYFICIAGRPQTRQSIRIAGSENLEAAKGVVELMVKLGEITQIARVEVK